MNFLIRISALAIWVLPLLTSCKATKSEPTSSTSTPQENVTTDGSMTSKDLDDMLRVSGTIRQDLENYFNEFSKLSLDDEEKRESYLSKGLSWFQDASTPVLIIVNEVNGKKIYDKPTTIEQYLDYLKHTRQSPHTINNFELNEAGRITKLELTLK